ncbi:HRDC domain-containing protein [Haploplasma modicum]|nr:HRDC domain-containing protein [Haploplasma modicum]MCR1809449.1 HRDC domain-containing protein [Haploplasma modicum]
MISKEHKIYPIYFVYNNATIKEIILKKPENLEELKNISGLGDQKINLFGTQIIEVVKKYLVNKDVEIKNELILLRKKISKYNKLNNEYSAYNDNVLDELVKLLPITIEDLKGIKGFKEENIQLFGQYLIKSIIEIKSKYLK